MDTLHTHQQNLLACIRLEEAEEKKRYQFNQHQSIKQLKAEGVVIHPIRVQRKSFGFADYPEFSFYIPFPQAHQFRDGQPIELFYQEEETIKGVLLHIQGSAGEIRLYAPDYPDWLEMSGVGIKQSPDIKTLQYMQQAVEQIQLNPAVKSLYKQMYMQMPIDQNVSTSDIKIKTWHHAALNESQQMAVRGMLNNPALSLLHGPPGTGKTTTLIEAIFQFVQLGKKIIVAAPSHAATDHMARGLIQAGINILRVGNTTKIAQEILPYTTEGKLQDKHVQKELKQLSIRANEFRKLALQYKRKFGKAEREQRQLLFKEVKLIREQIKKTLQYYENKWLAEAQVVLGTPVAISDEQLHKQMFDVLIIDEAGQCLEPLAWMILPLAKQWIIAGDPCQLPPTVLSVEAIHKGFQQSFLERCMQCSFPLYFLDTQYRMQAVMANFSGKMFYQSALQTAPSVKALPNSLVFYDTAGAGFEEAPGPDGGSLQNEGEMKAIQALLQLYAIHEKKCAVISPYAGQIILAQQQLPKSIRCATIDSFQGQEYDYMIVSLVRSNDKQQIGFLADTRRMNVAFTRAKKQLIIVGDSATIGSHPFYADMLAYIEEHATYNSVWELDIF